MASIKTDLAGGKSQSNKFSLTKTLHKYLFANELSKIVFVHDFKYNCWRSEPHIRP